MHPNPIYHSADPQTHLEFASRRGFGQLLVNGPDGPLAAHIPFILRDRVLTAHMARSNAVVRALAAGPVQALLIVNGPDGYISPDWYGVENEVPTWNYIAVHLRGVLALADPASMRNHLADLSDHFEQALLPKPVWKLDKVSPDVMDRFLRMILPIRFEISASDGTWKLNQGKTPAARRRVVAALPDSPLGSDREALAAAISRVDDRIDDRD